MMSFLMKRLYINFYFKSNFLQFQLFHGAVIHFRYFKSIFFCAKTLALQIRIFQFSREHTSQIIHTLLNQIVAICTHLRNNVTLLGDLILFHYFYHSISFVFSFFFFAFQYCNSFQFFIMSFHYNFLSSVQIFFSTFIFWDNLPPIQTMHLNQRCTQC